MDAYTGEIRLFGGNYAPHNWALCDGSLLPISSNTALFSLLGNRYGGNGKVSFGLPDLRGCVPVNQGSGQGLTPRSVGDYYGTETETLTAATMPAHQHSLSGSTSPANTASPEGATFGAGVSMFTTSAPNIQYPAELVGAYGQSGPHENMAPFQVLNYIICTSGIFPNRP